MNFQDASAVYMGIATKMLGKNASGNPGKLFSMVPKDYLEKLYGI